MALRLSTQRIFRLLYQFGSLAGAAHEPLFDMNDDMDIIRGSGNLFRDLGHPDADHERRRALLAAQIIGVLDDRKLTVSAAHRLTGVAAADVSRIRKADLGRFTTDRLTTILAGLENAERPMCQ
jgi:predicted XRE-type DNA-binding protein